MENRQTDDSLDALEAALQEELATRQREDTGGETNAIGESGKQRTGVLLRLLSAIQDEKEYRQQLLTSDFVDDEEADRVAAAFTEANRYGLSLTPVIDWCAARCSVNKQGHGKSRAVLGIEGLTHSTFSVFGRNRDKKEDKRMEQQQ